MSRTFKDQPWWVVSPGWEQFHKHCDFQYLSRFGWASPNPRDRVCDLPAEPDLKAWKNWDGLGWRAIKSTCMWIPTFPYTRQYGKGTPPKWYRDHVWMNPVRVRERDYAREAIKEYRANGDVEAVLPDDKAKNCAKWLWW